jgi:putative methionine-R-sulfoxide reductase with GAF domain
MAPYIDQVSKPNRAQFGNVALHPMLHLHESVPLFGALLVAEGAITLEQLNACLLLQTQDYPTTPIGQILLRCGYINETKIEEMLQLQQDLKVHLLGKIEAHQLKPADMKALLLYRHDYNLIGSLMAQLGVITTQVQTWEDFTGLCHSLQPDLLLVDPELLPVDAPLSGSFIPTCFLPPSLQSSMPAWFEHTIRLFVEQARLQRQHRKSHESWLQSEFELSSIATMCRNISIAQSPHDALVYLMSTIRDIFDIEASTLYLYDQSTQQLVFEIVMGPNQEVLSRQRLSVDRGIAGWVVRHREPLLIPNVQNDGRFEGTFDQQSGFCTRSVLCVPMIAMGRVRGVIQLINKLNGDFNERDLLLMRVLASLGALAEAVAQVPAYQHF